MFRVSSFETVDGRWRIIRLNEVHNDHPMLSPEEFARDARNREIDDVDLERARSLRAAGLKVPDVMRVIESEHGGKLSTQFTAKDLQNHLASEASLLAGKDAMYLLEYLRRKQKEDSEYFYTISVDDVGRLENIFWMDGASRSAATVFSDVVIFDTTYRLNRYGMPFCPFVGVNQFGQTILLGCALLRAETKPTFKWVLQSWKAAVGRSPLSVLTDQDAAMKAAISEEFPKAAHALCIWHITRKFPGWFSSKLGPRYGNFVAAFYQVRKAETVEEFKRGWSELCKSYGLETDARMQGLYDLRENIGLAYLRRSFFAGLTTTQRSESINSFFDGFFDASTLLREFIMKYENALDARRLKEIDAARREKLYQPTLRTALPMEEQASRMLTKYAFQLFQEEVAAAMMYLCILEDDSFIIRHYSKSEGGRMVKAINGEMKCSCENFEFTGIICRHAIRAFIQMNQFTLPEQYLPRRWRKDALERQRKDTGYPTMDRSDRMKTLTYLSWKVIDTGSVSANTFAFASERLEVLAEELSAMLNPSGSDPDEMEASDDGNPELTNPPQSKKRGRPKMKRAKHPIEQSQKERQAAKQVTGAASQKMGRHCRVCQSTDHDFRNCPHRKCTILETKDPDVALPS